MNMKIAQSFLLGIAPSIGHVSASAKPAPNSYCQVAGKKTPSLCTQKSLLQLLGTTEKIAEDWILHNSPRSPSSQVTESID